jgi:hypothetical protein
MFVDELDYSGSRGSNPRATKPAAALRISLARLSSRTSRSNSTIRCTSTVDAPGRLPPSTSAAGLEKTATTPQTCTDKVDKPKIVRYMRIIRAYRLGISR